MEKEQLQKPAFTLPSPSVWLSKFITLQAAIVYTCLIALLSPFVSFLSLFSESFRVEKTKENVESAVQAAAKVPSKVVRGSTLLLKKIGIGFLAAVYVFVALTVLLVVAFILGIGLVKLWVEQPVILREGLHFDYTQVHPVADFAFGSDYGGFEGHHSHWHLTGTKLTAEIISSNGQRMEKATHPCMIRFRSWPIRIMRTFIMGIPLLLGIKAETQTIKVAMLKHKEDLPRTASIRIILSSRAGTDFLPQLYDAEILLNSQLPWWKELVRRWKWTLYVWTSMYVYIILLLVLLSFFRPLILPELSRGFGDQEQNLAVEASEETESKSREESDVSQSLRRWHRSRDKRKAMLLLRDDLQMPEFGGSTATSISITRDDTGMNLGEETGDSESICYRGQTNRQESW